MSVFMMLTLCVCRLCSVRLGWQPFGKKLFPRLAMRSLCVVSIECLMFSISVSRTDVCYDCASSWSLLIFKFERT